MSIYPWSELLHVIAAWRITIRKLHGARSSARRELIGQASRIAAQLIVAAEERGIDATSLLEVRRQWSKSTVAIASILVDRLEARAGIEGKQSGSTAAKIKRRGRPVGSKRSDPTKDAKLYTDWKASDTNIADFCGRRGLVEEDTRAAINRHKNRCRVRRRTS